MPTTKSFTTKGKATIWVSFLDMPSVFEVYRNGRLEFFRILNGKYSTIKFNVVRGGNYTTNVECTTLQVLPITIHPLNITLPPHEREEMKSFKIIKNLKLEDTPARNFVKDGIIETGKMFEQLPAAIQHFILLHEKGHFYYKTEEYCDLYAADIYIKQGYNNSMAYYSLTRILHPSDLNSERIHKLFEKLHR